MVWLVGEICVMCVDWMYMVGWWGGVCWWEMYDEIL